MWKFRNGNAFVLFFWTCYGPVLFDAPAHLVRAQIHPRPDVWLLDELPANVDGPLAPDSSGLQQQQQPAGAAVAATVAAAATPATTSQQQQPCDRTRRVFTEAFGEISDGPAGSNYTQVKCARICANSNRFKHSWQIDAFLSEWRTYAITTSICGVCVCVIAMYSTLIVMITRECA